jgi:GR25 family glycosyltransferase involved in LPS biosynthesis
MYISDPYIINLDSATDRWSDITETLAKHNIPYSRFPAINGKNLSHAEIAKHTTWFTRIFTLTHSIIGCALSHYEAMRTARQSLLAANQQQCSDQAWLLILEDDAVILPGYHESMARLRSDLEWLYRNKSNEYSQMDIIKLCRPNTHLPSSAISTYLLTIPNPKYPAITYPDALNYSYTSYRLAAHNTAYIVKCSSVDKILDYLNTQKINTHIDIELGLVSNIGTYYTSQTIIDSQVDNFDSSCNLANTYPKTIVHAVYGLNRLGLLSTYVTFGVIQPGAGFNLHYKIADVWLIFLALLFIVWLFTRFIYAATWNPWPYVLIYWIADTILFYRG